MTNDVLQPNVNLILGMWLQIIWSSTQVREKHTHTHRNRTSSQHSENSIFRNEWFNIIIIVSPTRPLVCWIEFMNQWNKAILMRELVRFSMVFHSLSSINTYVERIFHDKHQNMQISKEKKFNNFFHVFCSSKYSWHTHDETTVTPIIWQTMLLLRSFFINHLYGCKYNCLNTYADWPFLSWIISIRCA